MPVLQFDLGEPFEIFVAEQRRTVVAQTARVHHRMIPEIFSLALTRSTVSR